MIADFSRCARTDRCTTASMLRNVSRQVSTVHAPIRQLSTPCAKSAIQRLFSTGAPSTTRLSADVEGNSKPARPREERLPYKPTSTVDAAKSRVSALNPRAGSSEEPEARPKRLLEPHVLSKRLRVFCDEGKLTEAIDALKTAPMDAQTVPVWNTLIWETLKAHRWNLAYKLFTDVSVWLFTAETCTESPPR